MNILKKRLKFLIYNEKKSIESITDVIYINIPYNSHVTKPYLDLQFCI